MTFVVSFCSLFSAGQSFILEENDGKALCECDRILMNTLVTLTPDNELLYYDANECVKGVQKPTACCNFNQFSWEAYNTERFDCCTDGVKEIGSC